MGCKRDGAEQEALQYHYTESISFLYEAALNIDDEEVLQTVLAWKEDPAGLVQRLRGYEALLGEANALYILRYGQPSPQPSRWQRRFGGR